MSIRRIVAIEITVDQSTLFNAYLENFGKGTKNCLSDMVINLVKMSRELKLLDIRNPDEKPPAEYWYEVNSDDEDFVARGKMEDDALPKKKNVIA